MHRKAFYVFLAVVTLAVAGGVFLLIHDSQPVQGIPEEGVITGPQPKEKPFESEIISQEATRELVAPEEAPPREPGAMPESYRQALGIVKGRVVEVEGTPVPGMKVEFFGLSALDLFQDAGAFFQEEPPALSFRTGVTNTGDDGLFVFKDVDPRAIYVLGVDLEGARSTSRIIDAIPGPGETVDLGDIVLAPHAVLIGKVVDEPGNPVSGARVRATQLPPVIFISGIQNYRDGCSLLARWEEGHRVFDPPPAFKQFARMLPVPTTTTAHDGAFRLEGVPLGLITVVVDRAAYVTVNKGPVSTAMGGEKDLGKIVLGSGVLLTGKVVDHEGEPAPGIEVRAGPMYGVPEAIILQPPLTTDEEGAFAIPGAPALPTFATARRYPEDPWTVVGPFHPGVEPPVLMLPPAFNLRVVVLREDGEGAKEIRLKMRERHPMGDILTFQPPVAPKLRMEESDEGIMDIKDLPPGNYELLVTAAGCGVTKEEVSIKAEPMEKHVILKPAYTARVRVLTEKTNSPVEWAEVYACLGEDAMWFNPTKLSRARTDGEGLAELDKLGEGKYQLSISHPRYAITAGTVDVPSGDETVIFLKPGGIIEGVVRTVPRPRHRA
jgi:protocatechuate 3,4-dioxygenase beta subunit